MTLKESIMYDLGKQMEEALDWEVVMGMLIGLGWIKVELPRYVDNHHAIDIREWVIEMCKGKSNNKGATWIFENPADATMFTLKWVK